jgi:hypothetical protein
MNVTLRDIPVRSGNVSRTNPGVNERFWNIRERSSMLRNVHGKLTLSVQARIKKLRKTTRDKLKNVKNQILKLYRIGFFVVKKYKSESLTFFECENQQVKLSQNICIIK